MVAKTDTSFVSGALFLSHTNLKDYTRCPKLFYLKNIYKDSKTGYKLQIASPNLTLGAVVHDALQWFLQMKGQASKDQLIQKYRNLWLKYRGKRGGFLTLEDEAGFGKRGLAMLDNFYENFKVLEEVLEVDRFLKFRLEPKVFLNGKLDFLGVLPDGTLHVLDFKTGTKDEEDPTQLYIYSILAESNYQKEVSKISFWYLDRDSNPKEAVLDPLDDKILTLQRLAKEIEQLVNNQTWICIKDPDCCYDCAQYQSLIDGKGEFLFSDDAYKKQVFFLNPN